MSAPTLVWFRRDLRLSDHPALQAAVDAGGPVIPVFIRDEMVDQLGTAPQWRLGRGLDVLNATLRDAGSRLILRQGPALEVLRDLVKSTGAQQVYWLRTYEPQTIARDTEIKSNLQEQGVDAKSFGGHLLFEPWSAQTKTGGFYKVYTPFWKAQKDRDVDAPVARPHALAAPVDWPESDALDTWALGAGMRRGASIVAQHASVGEAAAQNRLQAFTEGGIAQYHAHRDLPDIDGTSRLSEHLSLGEISPRQCWHAAQRALAEGKPGAETFAKQLVWRDFAYHLLFHTPHIATGNWKPEWDAFPWNDDPHHPHFLAWTQGRTGIEFVDAAMRELYVTGRMHNRGRMIVASYLTKHLMTHWQLGLKWFEDCLIDWDPACNAMGWQWAAGSGPDAAPYFRVFNPDTQREKFDPRRAYIDRWIAEGKSAPHVDALSYFDAIPERWQLSPSDRYPRPVVSLAEGRNKALDAYQARSKEKA